MSQTVQFKRGLKTALPTDAAPGEVLVTLDTGEVFLGGGPGIPLKRVADTVRSATAPGVEDQDKVWIDTANNDIKIYKDGSWQPVAASVAGTDFGTF